MVARCRHSKRFVRLADPAGWPWLSSATYHGPTTPGRVVASSSNSSMWPRRCRTISRPALVRGFPVRLLAAGMVVWFWGDCGHRLERVAATEQGCGSVRPVRQFRGSPRRRHPGLQKVVSARPFAGFSDSLTGTMGGWGTGGFEVGCLHLSRTIGNRAGQGKGGLERGGRTCLRVQIVLATSESLEERCEAGGTIPRPKAS